MKIGVLGNGQLAQMMALAGISLGHEFVFFDENPEGIVSNLGKNIITRPGDEQQLMEFADSVDIITVEKEHIPKSTLKALDATSKLMPGSKAVFIAQDRLLEKQFLQSVSITLADYYEINSLEQLQQSASDHGDTLILKTRHEGYDGKGQFVIKDPQQCADAWQQLSTDKLVAEQRIKFSREVSMICARNAKGDTCFYPVAENVHQNGILALSSVRVNDPMQSKAQEHARRILEGLDYVGVLGCEFFEVDGELLVNEIAPRVHNSGHWTMDGSYTSQFENHIRAILNLPLGLTDAHSDCIMFNLIGEVPDASRVLEIAGTNLHDYGKQARSGRKLGHINLCENNTQNMQSSISQLEKLINIV